MKRTGVLVLVLACGVASEALAQGVGTSVASRTATPPASIGRPVTFGTQSDIVYVVNAFDFAPFTNETTAGTAEGSRFFVGGPGFLEAGINLPNGASVIGFELQACDTSGIGTVFARLYSNTVAPPIETAIEHGFLETGVGFNAGCAFFFSSITPVTVDNSNRNYFIEVGATLANSANRFAAVRVYYRLQVSPAPGTASFSDVPLGHPLHRFVEALVAAGITGGCGGGNYCPDAPLSRGQMAVFLAAALGLHWPN
jgi:hypothetical protein